MVALFRVFVDAAVQLYHRAERLVDNVAIDATAFSVAVGRLSAGPG